MSKPRAAKPAEQVEAQTQAKPAEQVEAVAQDVSTAQPEAPAVETPPLGEDGAGPLAAPPVEPVEPLSNYIAKAECAKLGLDVVAVAITHPEVMQERVHPGTYGGIRLSNGPVGVVYSDGTKA